MRQDPARPTIHASARPYALAVDVGGTSTKLAVVTADGRILERTAYPTVPGTLAAFGARLIDTLGAFMAECESSFNTGLPVGIGIGMRGIIDAEAQRYLSGSLFARAEEYDLCAAVAEACGTEVHLANDVKAAALAELRWGGQGSCFTYVNIGTGIGAAIVDHGHLLQGRTHHAGEIYRYVIERAPQNPRSLESFASGQGFDAEALRLASEHPGSPLGDGSSVSERLRTAYEAGDPLAVALLDPAIAALAQTIVNIEAITDSSAYILGGGVMTDGDWLVRRLRSAIDVLCSAAGVPWSAAVTRSRLTAGDVGLLGAAALVLGDPDSPTTANAVAHRATAHLARPT